MTEVKYSKPEKHIHKGFFYLDDETVINSLSAVESGKVDEVVAKINSARKGGVAASVGVPYAKFEGGKEATSSLEEEIVRTRTRFSVFELWFQNLIDNKALGQFNGWGSSVLNQVEPGDTIEVQARMSLAPLQILLRQYLWFAEQARTQGSLFFQKGEGLKSTKDAERNIRLLIGSEGEDHLTALAFPNGGAGPTVAMQLQRRWLVGNAANLAGNYTVVAQVDQIVQQGEEVPTLRIFREAPATAMELTALREVVSAFIEPAKAFGVTISESDGGIVGPALLLTPIAIYR